MTDVSLTLTNVNDLMTGTSRRMGACGREYGWCLLPDPRLVVTKGPKWICSSDSGAVTSVCGGGEDARGESRRSSVEVEFRDTSISGIGWKTRDNVFIVIPGLFDVVPFELSLLAKDDASVEGKAGDIPVIKSSGL